MKDSVFEQIMKPITGEMMEACNKRYKSDYDSEHFKTWEHIQTMVYVQLQGIKSLRTLEVAINSQQIGIKTQVKRSTLSDANARRSAESFMWVLGQLMSRIPRAKRKEIKKVVRIMDSSPIKLKGKGYDDWGKEKATAHWQGIKLHVEYDLGFKTATKIETSYANYNDCSMGQRWPIVRDTVYVFDKGYYDYNWWWSIHQREAYFVTRLKKNVAIKLEKEREAAGNNILGDDDFRFKNKHPRGGKKNHYDECLRRISVAREGKSPLILVTNLQTLSAMEVADLYKARWEIELFFKWLKQHLKIKKFLGKSANAVKIQLATALIAYLLVQLYKRLTQARGSLQLVLVWVRCNLAAAHPYYRPHDSPACNYI